MAMEMEKRQAIFLTLKTEVKNEEDKRIRKREKKKERR
jgi:hypothetical protein